MAHRISLSGHAAAAYGDYRIVLVARLGELERLHDPHARGRTRKVIIELATIYRDRAVAGHQANPRDSRFALANGPNGLFPVGHFSKTPIRTRSLSAAGLHEDAQRRDRS